MRPVDRPVGNGPLGDGAAGAPVAAAPTWEPPPRPPVDAAPAPPARPDGAPLPSTSPTATQVALVPSPPPTPIFISTRVRNVIVLAVVLALGATFWMAPSALVVLLVGTLVAVLLSIPVDAFQRFVPRMPRGLAVLASLALVLLVLAAVFFLVIPPLLAELEAATESAPRYAATLEQALRTNVVERLAGRGQLPADTSVVLTKFFQSLAASVQGASQEALDSLLAILSGLAGGAFLVMSIVVIALYLVGDAPRLKASFLEATPSRYRSDARELWETMGRSLARMLAAALTSNTIQGGAAYIGLSLIGVPLAGLLGMVMWLTAFIPIAGAWLGGIPAFLVALTVSPQAALWTALLYFAINLLDGNVLTPRLQGQALTVHPVIILVAIVAAGELFGLVGVLVMLPLLATVRVLATFMLRRLRVRSQNEQLSNA